MKNQHNGIKLLGIIILISSLAILAELRTYIGYIELLLNDLAVFDMSIFDLKTTAIICYFIVLVLILILTIIWSYTVFLFFTKKKQFIKYFIITIVISPFISIFSKLIIKIFVKENLIIFTQDIQNICIASLIYSIVWIPFLVKSKSSKETFVN